MKKFANSGKVLALAAMLTLPLAASAHTTWCNAKYGWSCNCGGGYAVPLEGAAALLIAAAAGLGIKRFKENKKDK